MTSPTIWVRDFFNIHPINGLVKGEIHSRSFGKGVVYDEILSTRQENLFTCLKKCYTLSDITLTFSFLGA